MKTIRVMRLFIVGSAILAVVFASGCGSDTAAKKRAYEQKVANEQAELEKEALKPDRPALPTADAAGQDFKDIPRPTNSFRLSSDITVKDGNEYGSVEYASKDTADSLVSFFESELKNKGWKNKSKEDKSMKGLPGALIEMEKGDIRCDIDMENHVTEQNEKYVRVTVKQFQKL